MHSLNECLLRVSKISMCIRNRNAMNMLVVNVDLILAEKREKLRAALTREELLRDPP